MNQPLTCPFCNAERIGIQEAMHVYKCGTKLFIRPERKVKAEMSRQCAAQAHRAALKNFDAAWTALQTTVAK